MSSSAEFSMRRLVGLIAMTAGLMLAAYPFISVWRLGGEVLSMLPEGGEQAVDDRSALALFDDDFVLGTRSYPNYSVGELEVLLSETGFDQEYRTGEDTWLWKSCCGAYDAALVKVTSDESGSSIAEMSVFDSDVQISWWFLSGMGGLLAFAGLVTVFSRGLKSDPRRYSGERVSVSVSKPAPSAART